MHSLLDPARLRPPATTPKLPTNIGLTVGQQSKVNLTLGLQGRDMDTVDIAPNPLHLQPPAERDIIIRNRIKTPTLDDEDDDEMNNFGGGDGSVNDAVRIEDVDGEDNEVLSISSVQFQPNSTVA